MEKDSKVNILLVDDNPNNLLALEAILEHLGHNLVKALSGKEALKFILKQEFALILLDVQMPDMDGFETASLIRGIEKTRHTPIIFITAIHQDEIYTSKGYLVGAIDYLIKPINREILLAKVEAFVDLYKETEQAKRQKEQEEEKAEEARERITNILETIRDGFIALDKEWRFTYINREAEGILQKVQRSQQELIGKIIWDEFPFLVDSIFYRECQRAIEEQAAGKFEFFFTLLKAWSEINLYPFKDGLSVYFRDITESKRAENRLTAQYEVSRVLAESPSLADATQRILQTICERLGWEAGQLWRVDRHTNLLRCIDNWHKPPFGFPEFEAISRQTALTPGFGLPGQICVNRAPIWIADITRESNFPRLDIAAKEGVRTAFAFPILLGGEVLGVIEFFSREIWQPDTKLIQMMATVGNQIGLFFERKLAEQERAQLFSSEQEARRRAEEAIRSKDEFLATVSHELRTPLTAILGWVQMLHTGSLDETTCERAIEVIERNTKLQIRIVEDILDVSNIITGNFRIDAKPVDLVPVIWAAMDTIRPAAEAKGIKLQVKLDTEGGEIIGDTARLQQVLWNLLSNALKFTPSGGRIEVRYERVGNNIELTVSDTGKGIGSEFLPYVFDRFRQADSSMTRKYGGLGLGLAIARHLVELHGGTIEIYSAGEGQGTTATVRLPLSFTRVDSSKLERSYSPAISLFEFDCSPVLLEGVKVLVVDDEPDARELITAVLEECGAEVKTSASAAEAIEKLEEWKPDVLISDIGMPEEDGYDLIRKVRAKHEGEQIPAAALTAFASVEDRRHALSAGYQMHIPKPVEPARLASVVASLAGRPGESPETELKN
jgi:signal transduction histidine kinase/DNA-binding response OmpR family regulator